MWAGDTDAAALAFARRHWEDARRMDDALVLDCLEAAQTAVVEFAPVLAEGAPVPVDYAIAHVYHAREVRAAAARGDGDAVGMGDFVIRPRPLTTAVKQLLRPTRGVPAIG